MTRATDYVSVSDSDGMIAKPNSSVDENKERGNWSNKIEFLLSCLSYAVGLGNIWRFPYLVYLHGGGAFIIPYFIMLFLAGLGYAMFIVSTLVGIYYNMIIAWTWFYLFSSFTDSLPWNSCDNWWNTEACQRFDTKNCTAHSGFMFTNGTCAFASQYSPDEWINITASAEQRKMPSDEYFHNFMLVISEGLHNMGTVRWQLALCLLWSWVLAFLALMKGVKSFGKLVYFTAFFPYLVLIILLIRAATLPGYMDGIMFYLIPQWHRLLEAKVWGDAAVQIFFSLSPCWGGLITLASYNTFHNNCWRDAVLIGIINPLTSFFAGFVIFGIVGFMAHELDISVEEVVGQGAGLAFIAYPEAVTRLPLSPLWAILFFIMLLTLGMGTQFTILETVVTTIVDEWPDKLRKYHQWVLLGVCIVMYFFGLGLCSEGGMYMLQLMDKFCATYSTLFIGLGEVVVLSWVYGVDKLLNDIKVMIGRYPFHPLYWKLMWKYVTPITLICILMFNIIDFDGVRYANYEFPTWTLALGWLMALSSVIMIPIVAICKLYRVKGTLYERVKCLIKPDESWGPKLQIHRAETDRPKHIDSQVPLAANPYVVEVLDDDGMIDDADGAGFDDTGLKFGNKLGETGV
uniref:Transporter n=1 Tax=Strigamia maritima TaxID=126957 RepID=T1JI01_STRMM